MLPFHTNELRWFFVVRISHFSDNSDIFFCKTHCILKLKQTRSTETLSCFWICLPGLVPTLLYNTCCKWSQEDKPLISHCRCVWLRLEQNCAGSPGKRLNTSDSDQTFILFIMLSVLRWIVVLVMTQQQMLMNGSLLVSFVCV